MRSWNRNALHFLIFRFKFRLFQPGMGSSWRQKAKFYLKGKSGFFLAKHSVNSYNFRTFYLNFLSSKKCHFLRISLLLKKGHWHLILNVIILFTKRKPSQANCYFFSLDDGVRPRAREMEGWRGSNGQRKPSQVN